MAIIESVGVIGAAALAIFFYFLWRHFEKRRLRDILALRLLSVRLAPHVPTDASKESSRDFKDDINLSAQLWSILANLKTPFALEAAVHHIGEEIHFYVAVPRSAASGVSRQIEGLFKDAKVEEASEYNIFPETGVTKGVYFEQKEHSLLPIRTYVEANVDTFAPLLSGLSKLSEVGEGAAIQIMARPAASSIKKSAMKMITQLKRGMKFEEVVRGLKITVKDFERALRPEMQQKEKEEKVIDEEAIKILQAKIDKPLLAVNMRVIAAASVEYQTDALLQGIVGTLSQFSAPLRNELKVARPRNFDKLVYQFSFRDFDQHHAMLLNIEELASLFHFPTRTTDLPKVKWLKAKEAVPPADLPTSGTLIGESVFRDEKKPVYLLDDDRRRHVYVIGQTGTGKSTLLSNMVVGDIRAGKGVAIIDPHGELIETILGLVPQERVHDVIVFDPSDLARPVGMNMLEYNFERPEEKTFIVNEVQNIFNKLFLAETMGPMFEQYMRNALLLLMEDAPNESATFMEVARVFTDADFRSRKLARIVNPMVIDFWEKEAIKAGGEASLANMTPYITSKFNNFTTNDYMRPIIGQPKSAFNFRDVMDSSKILLVNLSKGKIGEINANLLGMVVTGKILMAAFSRADIKEQSERRDFNLYIDEFQNFSTDSIASILSEARKYGLNLTMAHQFIAQLTDKIRDAVFGNVGSLITFRVGAKDAEFLVKQFAPVFSESDLVNIDNFHTYVKLLIRGATTKPFNVRTLSSEKGDALSRERLREFSRAKYGSDRAEVEGDIKRRLRE